MERWTRVIGVICLVCVGIVAPISVAADGTTAVRYVALGDSYAYGIGSSKPTTQGYVGLLVAYLGAATRTTIGALDLADPGATSADLIGDYPARGSQGTSQLARGAQLLATGGANLVTLDIGGNDILRLLELGQPCAGNAILTDTCLAAVQGVLRGDTARNLPQILGVLLAAAQPNAHLLVLTYPNPYSVGVNGAVEQRTNEAVQALNTIITGAVAAAQPLATARGVTLTTVDLFPLFAGRSGTLTHFLDAPSDIHPNDAGYQVIAGAVVSAYQHLGGDATIPPGQSHFVTRLSG